MVEVNTNQTSSSTDAGVSRPQRRHKTVPPQKHETPLNAILITFSVIILAVFFGLQLVMRTGVFQPQGKIILADDLTEENINFINTNLGELQLEHDVTISRFSRDTRYASDNSILYKVPREFCLPSEDTSVCDELDSPWYILYNILLPTTDWDSPDIDISFASVNNSNLVSIWDLNKSQKLLKLDGNYFLDTFDSGAVFEYLSVSGAAEDTEKVAQLLAGQIATFPTKDEVLTLAQTGVTALTRNMTTKLAQVGNATYFAEKIGPFLSSFDFTHTSNEASFSQLANSNNICAKPAMIDVLTTIGLDIVELTGNHNIDCGDTDAITTIELYQQLGMKTFGGGTSSETAAIPLEIEAKGTHITMLGYNLSTGGYTQDDTPGANFYTKEKAQQDINAAKARGDFVIVDIQYYECNEYVNTEEDATCDAANSSAGDQVGFFRELIDMGANIVVGTSAHQPQTFEQYHGGEIYYGLGNLFFDQSAWPGTTRSLVLVNYFLEGKLLQTRIVPTVYNQNYQTEIMSDNDAANFLARLLKVQPDPADPISDEVIHNHETTPATTNPTPQESE